MTTQRERFTLDGGQAVNCLSIGLLVCLMPRDPLGADRYFAASLLVFTSIAFLNHLAPRRLHRLTHVVKAAYTHVLVASVSGTPDLLAIAAATIASVVDLSPLWLRSARTRDVAEGLGATVRWTLIGFGFVRMGFVPWLVIVYALCTAVYAWERNRRIIRGRRHEYGLAHSLEHVSVWLYLLVLDAERIDVVSAVTTTMGLIVGLAIALVVFGIATNLWILHRLPARLPGWFDPRLRALLLTKATDNAFSHRLQHYVFKPFAPTISNCRVRWADVEHMVDSIEVRERFDVVVGVLSGGAFLARYVASRHDIGSVVYVRSRLWSNLPLARNLVLAVHYYRGQSNLAAASFLDGTPDLRGRRVLVVDDSVCTGATMATVRELCEAHGAARVATMALFTNPDHPTDYCARSARTPLVWPWGWESD